MTLLIFVFSHLLYFKAGNNIFIHILCCLATGISIIFFSYNIMHDGSHYAISTKPKVNEYLTKFNMGILFWNFSLWMYHHCIRHHQYTGMT